MQAAALVLWSVSLAGCSSERAAPAPGPDVALQAIPPSDPAQYESLHDMKKWRNPYLIVRADDVALLDAADSAEIMLKPDELLPALSRLPASDWPYGRVVAAAVPTAAVSAVMSTGKDRSNASDPQAIAIRRNKGIVGGLLQGAHIAIKWVPSS